MAGCGGRLPSPRRAHSNPAMVTLASLWLPILVSAVFVFIASSLIHMVLQSHNKDYGMIPDEDGFLELLRRSGVQPGQYVFPGCKSMKELGTPEMQAKFAKGPIGTLIVRPSGGLGMGKSLFQWFLFCVMAGVFVAYLTGLAAAPGAESQRVFRIAATAALFGHAFWCVHDSIWKGIAWATTGRFMFDGLVYALVTGATFAWLWPAAA